MRLNRHRDALKAFLLGTALLLSLPLPDAQAVVSTNITSSGLGTSVNGGASCASACTITGGTTSGSNLFHSFGYFNVGTGDIANFSVNSGIANIIGRVTGGQISNIDGTLRVTWAGSGLLSNANLYLLNPAGVFFGANARLDTAGSFHVSTADYLKFTDGQRFSMSTTSSESALLVASPAAFGFLSGNPAGITIQGSTLQVPTGQTLSIVGGDITMTGGSLSAPSGQINLASVKGQAGEVLVSNSQAPFGTGQIQLTQGATVDVSGDPGGTVVIRGGQLVLDYAAIESNTLGNADGAQVGVDVQVRGDVSLANGAAILSTALGDGRGGDISIVAGGAVSLDRGDSFADVFFPPPNLFLFRPTGLYAFSKGGNGDAGNIAVSASSVSLTGAGISATAFSPCCNVSVGHTGRAGDITINATGTVSLNGGGMASGTGTNGDGGNITVTASSVSLTNGASISATTSGVFLDASGHTIPTTGHGGNITITATGAVSLDSCSSAGGCSELFTGTSSNGDAGAITVSAGSASLTNGAQINSSTNYGTAGRGGDIMITTTGAVTLDSGYLLSTTLGTGDAGHVSVSAGSLALTHAATIETSSAAYVGGRGGDITIATPGAVTLEGASNIFSETFGSGDAGHVSVSAGSLAIHGGRISSSSNFPGVAGRGGDITITTTGDAILDGGIIYSRAFGSGDAGNISVSAESLTLTGFAQIRTDTSGAGRGGDITITTPGAVTLDNIFSSSPGLSLISSSTSGFFASGAAGNISITAGSLSLANGAQITANTSSPGHGGDITINTSGGAVSLTGSGTGLFSSTSGAGDAGATSVTTGTLALSGGARIDASTQGGTGHVSIFPDGTQISNLPDPTGHGGIITIQASNSVSISGPGSGLFTNSEPGALVTTIISSNTQTTTTVTSGVGPGGEIRVQAGNITLSDGAAISAKTSTDSAAGNVTLTAPTVTISGGAEVSTATSGIGAAGGIALNVGTLTVQSGATISSSSTATGAGTGAAGSITVQGLGGAGTFADSITLDGSGSGLSSSTAGSGNAGAVSVSAGSLTLSNSAQINTSTSGTALLDAFGHVIPNAAARGGDITINAGTVNITGGAQIKSSTTGSGHGGDVTITATDLVSISGTDMTLPGNPSGIVTKTLETGDAGSVSISARSMEIKDGARIESGAGDFSTTRYTDVGNAGAVTIIATDSISMSGGGTFISSGSVGNGNAGAVTLTTGTFTMTDNSLIESTTNFGTGHGGDVTVNARDLVSLSGAAITAFSQGGGDAGNVSISTRSFGMTNAAAIITDTFPNGGGGGRGGDIRINATESVTLSGGVIEQSALITPDGPLLQFVPTIIDSRTTGSGHAGDVLITTPNLTISGGARIDTSTFGIAPYSADGGNITITATDSVSIIGRVTFPEYTAFLGTALPPDVSPVFVIADSFPSGIFSRTQGSGNAGNVSITTNALNISAGGVIDTSTLHAPALVVNAPYLPPPTPLSVDPTGHGGNITLTANAVTLSGPGSGLLTNSEPGKLFTFNLSDTGQLLSQTTTLITDGVGAGGDIHVQAQNVTLTGGATISAKSSTVGAAGGITLKVADTLLMQNSKITTQSDLSDAGDIKIIVGNMVHLIDSEITTHAAVNGGNILIDPNFVILDSSKIIASAIAGNGGNISIVAGVFLASPDSVLDASSSLGVSGSINISSPVTNLSGTLAPLSQEFLQAGALLHARCAARQSGKSSSFVVTGRDGLPPAPGGVLPSPLLLAGPAGASGGLALQSHLLASNMTPSAREQGCAP